MFVHPQPLSLDFRPPVAASGGLTVRGNTPSLAPRSGVSDPSYWTDFNDETQFARETCAAIRPESAKWALVAASY
jgi:hypothetical protein